MPGIKLQIPTEADMLQVCWIMNFSQNMHASGSDVTLRKSLYANKLVYQL